MRFYIFKNKDEKIAIAEKDLPGEAPNVVHDEITVPDTFIISLPSRILTKVLLNAENAAIELQYLTSLGTPTDGTGLRHGQHTLWGDAVKFKNHLSYIPELHRLRDDLIVYEQEEKELPPDEFADNLDDEEKTVPTSSSTAPRRPRRRVKERLRRDVITGATFETVKAAFAKAKEYSYRNEEGLYYVGYASFIRCPDALFITKDINAVQELILRGRMQDDTQLAKYRLWTWYYSYSIPEMLRYIVDMLATESINQKTSLLTELELFNKDYKPLAPVTYGKQLLDVMQEFFEEKKIPISANKKAGGGPLQIIHEYMDDREASVCDLYIYPRAEKEALDHLRYTVDKAFVRTGLCGFLAVEKSPDDKRLLHRELDDELKESDEKFIPNIPKLTQQFFILGPYGYFYTSKMYEPISEKHVITRDRHVIAKLWELLTGSVTPRDCAIRKFTSDDQAVSTKLTCHVREHDDQVHFVNLEKKQFIKLENVKGELLERLDEFLLVNIHSDKSRILFFNELAMIKRLTGYDYQKEIEIIEEETKEEIVAPVERSDEEKLYEAKRKVVNTLKSLVVMKDKKDKFLEALAPFSVEMVNELFKSLATILRKPNGTFFNDQYKTRFVTYATEYYNKKEMKADSMLSFAK